MPILALAARHHEVGLENLERLAASPEAVRRAVVSGCAHVQGAVVLATCNRVELYLDVTEGVGAGSRVGADVDPVSPLSPVLRAVAASLGLDPEVVASTLERVPDPAAHLCEVASGLDSMVLGEREIAGQVRRALAEARADGATTGSLERLFAAASRAARRVANETRLGALGRSLVDVALDAAQAPAGSRCLLVGTGSYAGAAAAALVRRGAESVDVYSASGRAASFASERGLGVVADGALEDAISRADVIVTCSGRPDVVLGPEHFARRDSGAPLAVVDLALRRDVDPDVGALPGVRLFSLRELAALAPEVAGGDLDRARGIAREVAAELAGADRALAWSHDLVLARRRALAAHPPHARDEVHARLHRPSALAHAAARAGDRRRFDAALVELAAVAGPVPAS